VAAIHDGAVRALVLVVGWPGRPLNVAMTETAVRERLATWVKPDLEANSYGRLTVDFDVRHLGNVLAGSPHCRLGDVIAEAIALVDATVDFRAYASVGVWAPAGGCGFGGVAYLCPVHVTTLDGRLSLGVHWDDGGASPDYAAVVTNHEWGHGQCSHHSRARTATGASEYGDQGSWMGNSHNRCQMRGVQKAHIGLLRPEEIAVVTTSGEVDFAALESYALTPKVVSIPSHDLWLEVRSPAAWCATRAAGKPFLAGVSVVQGQADGGSLLLGPNGGPATGWDAVPVGGAFVTEGLRVDVLAVGNGRGRVRVTLGSTTTSTTRPTTTSTRASTTTTSSTSRPPTTVTPTTTTLRCIRRRQSCLVNGVRHPERCCSGRCGKPGNKCRQ
jgi:hypothetical protein